MAQVYAERTFAETFILTILLSVPITVIARRSTTAHALPDTPVSTAKLPPAETYLTQGSALGTVVYMDQIASVILAGVAQIAPSTHAVAFPLEIHSHVPHVAIALRPTLALVLSGQAVQIVKRCHALESCNLIQMFAPAMATVYLANVFADTQAGTAHIVNLLRVLEYSTQTRQSALVMGHAPIWTCALATLECMERIVRISLRVALYQGHLPESARAMGHVYPLTCAIVTQIIRTRHME
jgi:hypothetical protein